MTARARGNPARTSDPGDACDDRPDEEPRLARPDRRGAARARAADLRPAPSPVGRRDRPASSRATCWTRSWRTSSGGHNIVSTVFIECGAMFKPDGPEALRAGRRDRVRERHRGDERLRPLRPDARRGRDRRHRRPAPGRRGRRRARRADRGGRRPLPRHPRSARRGTPTRRCPTTAPVPPQGLFLRDDFRAGFAQLAPRAAHLRGVVLPPPDPRRHRAGARLPRHHDHPRPLRRPARRRLVRGPGARRSTRSGAATSPSWRTCPNVVAKLGGHQHGGQRLRLARAAAAAVQPGAGRRDAAATTSSPSRSSASTAACSSRTSRWTR